MMKLREFVSFNLFEHATFEIMIFNFFLKKKTFSYVWGIRNMDLLYLVLYIVMMWYS